jgi:hypothetical protein
MCLGFGGCGTVEKASPKRREAEFYELRIDRILGRSPYESSANFALTEFSEVVQGSRAFSQEGGIDVARLKASSSSEAKMIAECADCTRLSCGAVHSAIASSMAAVLTTS